MTDINLNVFSPDMQSLPGFSSLVKIMEASTIFTGDINTFAQAGGQFVLGGTGSSATKNQITISSDVFDVLAYGNSSAIANVATVFAHELGHATQTGGVVDNFKGLPNAAAAGDAEDKAEGVAVTYEYEMASDLSSKLGFSVNMWSNSPYNQGNDGLQATLAQDAQTYAGDSKQTYDNQVKDAAAAYATFTPSPAPHLTYFVWGEDQWIAKQCGITVDWYNATQNSFMDTVHADGTCSFNGADVPLAGGGVVSFSGQTLSSGALTSLNESVYLNGSSAPVATVIDTNGVFTASSGGYSFSDTLANTQAIVDALGNITFTSPVTSSNSCSLTIDTSGASYFTLGANSINFSSGSLTSMSGSNGSFTFGLASSVAGDTESITLDSTTGLASLQLSGASSRSVSLGTIDADNLLNVYSDGNTNSVVSVKNSAGQVVRSTVATSDEILSSSNDGSSSFQFFDTITGILEVAYKVTGTDKVVSEFVNPKDPWGNFYAASVKCAAQEVITRLLIKNNLPASLAAEAATSAAVNAIHFTGSSGETFATDFSSTLTTMVGSLIASNEVGDLFNSIGLPTQLGSLTGTALATALTQQVTLYLAKDVLGMTAAELASAGLSTATDAVSLSAFANTLGSAFEGAGAGMAGSYLAMEIFPNEGEYTQVGVTVGETIGAIWGPIGSFIGSFVGALVGDLAAWIFGGGYRGNPYAESNIGYSNGYYVINTTTDNNGDPAPAAKMGAAVVQAANQILSSMGATVTSARQWAIGYKGSQYLTFDPTTGPYYTWYGDANSAVTSMVMILLQNVSLSGGNPFMRYVFALDRNASFTTLCNDLSVARDYNVYQGNQMAFYAAIAMNGNATVLQNWLSELSRAQALGLTNFTSSDGKTLTVTCSVSGVGPYTNMLQGMISGDPLNFAIVDTLSNVMAVMSPLQAMRSSGTLASIEFSDAVMPTLSLTAAQCASYQPVLSTIITTYTLLVADTASNIVANLTTLQTLAAAGQLTSITATDGGTLALTASKITSYVTALGKLTGTYKMTVSDTGANVVANLAALQTLAAAGKLTSIALTDSGTPTMTITVAQSTSDATALGMLTGTYIIKVLNTSSNVMSSTQYNANGSSITTNYNTTTGGVTGYALNGTGGLTVTGSAGNSVSVAGNGSTNDTVNISNGTVTIATNSQTNIVGGGNVITAGQNDTIGIQGGNNDTVTVGSYSGVWLNNGSGHVVNAANGDYISVSGNGAGGASDIVNMSSGTVNIATNACSDIVGGNNVITAGQNDAIGIQGGDNDTVTVGAGSGVWLNNGGGHVVNAANGDWITVSGNGDSGISDIVNVSNGYVALSTNAVSDIFGSNDTITTGQNDAVGIQGGNYDTVTVGADSGVWLNNGYGHVVNAANGDWITVNGNGQTGTADTINMTSGTVGMGNNVNVTVSGSGNVITTAQNDTVTISSGSNTIVAGSGGDIFTNSGSGTNTYQFGTSFGQDTINNAGSGNTAAGVVAFTSSTDENLWFQKSGNNLQIDVIGTTEQITLSNWYGTNASAQVTSFTANGITLLDSQVAQLVSAMASYAANNNAFNPVTATSMPTNTALQTAIAASWH